MIKSYKKLKALTVDQIIDEIRSTRLRVHRRHGGRRERVQARCAVHKPAFDLEAFQKGLLTSETVRRRWPRFSGYCPACGFYGDAYASFEHYIAGDW